MRWCFKDTPLVQRLSLLVELLGLCSRPFLLGRALAAGLGDVEMLDPVFFVLVDECILAVQRPQLSDGADAGRVVGGDRGSLEALVQDTGSKTQALGVVGGVEDAALGLRMLAMFVRCREGTARPA